MVDIPSHQVLAMQNEQRQERKEKREDVQSDKFCRCLEVPSQSRIQR